MPKTAKHRPEKKRKSSAGRRNAARKPLTGDIEKISGKHAVRSVLLTRPRDIQMVLIAGKEEHHAEVVSLAHRHDAPVFLVPWDEFNRRGQFTEDDKHQGVFCLAKSRDIWGAGDLERLSRAKTVLLLDQVSNPQNFATIVRSAAFFRVDAIIYMKFRAAALTEEVVRIAVGGAELVEFYCVTNLADAIDAIRDLGFSVYGLDERGDRTLAEIESGEQVAFVIGAEGEGLRAKTRERCSELVRIPGGRKGLESVNAAVAATIAMYEAKRLVMR